MPTTGTENHEHLAERLRALRKRKHLTVVEIAAAIGVTPGAVAWWLSGERKPRGLYRRELERFLERVEDAGGRAARPRGR